MLPEEELKSYMSKQDKTRIDDIFFEKFKDTWVVTSRTVVEGGRPMVATPPVSIIPLKDKCQLIKTIRKILSEEVSVIPGAVFDDPAFSVDESYKLLPLGLKSMRAFYKHSRGFWLKKSVAKLHLEEWEKYRGGGYTGTLWSKDFGPDDFDGLVEFLLEIVEES